MENVSYTVENILTKKGLANIKVNNYLLHSQYDPIREADRFVEQHYQKGYVHILFGYGAGYIVQGFLKVMKEDDQLIVIDPILPEIEQVEGDYILIHENNIDLIKKRLIKEIKVTNFHKVIPSTNYDKISYELLKELLIFMKEQLFIKITVENTINLRSFEWQRNYIYNLEHLVEDDSLSSLFRKYSKPVVIASGGPSLTKQIAFLKEVRKDILLISAGSTINSLLKENIEPDYIVSIDANIANYNHFKEQQFKNSKLVYLMQSYPDIRKHFDSQCYYFLSLNEGTIHNHMTSLIEKNIPMLPGGGSVANFALSVAHYISSGPIALIGQDLAYTNNETHAKNNKQYSTIDTEQAHKKGYFYSEGYYNDQVLTDYVFMGMKRSFESIIQVFKDIHVYNCTEGGIKLEGFKQIPFREYVKKFVVKSFEDNIKDETVDNVLPLISKDDIVRKMKNEREVYVEIIDLLDKNIKSINLNKLTKEFEQRILKRLDSNDKDIQKYIKQTCLTSILDPINIEVIKKFKAKKEETPVEKYNRIKEQNLTLYSKMIEAIKETDTYIEELLIRLEKVQ